MKKEITQIKNLLKALENTEEGIKLEAPSLDLPFQTGKPYLIRTVTHYYTGRLSEIVGKFLILDECCWIADTGRFMEAVKEGKFNEVEPMGNSVIVNSDAVIDAVIVSFKLPLNQK